jgi:hypothetical protein
MLELLKTKDGKYNLTLLHLKLLISDGIKLNWTQNKSLGWIIEWNWKLQLASLQGGISINNPGQPYNEESSDYIWW